MQLIRLMDDKRLVGLVGYQMRFHPCLRRLRELLAARGGPHRGRAGRGG